MVGGGSLLQANLLKVQASVQVLLVSRTAIAFGNVFPGEVKEETYTVQLDTSADIVGYETTLTPVPDLLDLCPFLEVLNIDIPPEPDTLDSSTLNRSFNDILDKWQVKLKTPGFKGQLSQDHDGGIIILDGDYGCKITIITRLVGVAWCSHGYWKQPQHFANWVNYSPNQLFSSVFEDAFPGKTLLQVLELTGGGLNALGRDTVAELLNAGKLENPGQSQAEVISMFNAVYPGTLQEYDALHSQFVFPENCPLN